MMIGKCPLTKVEMGLVIPENWHSTWALPCKEHQVYPVVLIHPEWLQYSFFQIAEVGSHGLWSFTQALALLRFFSFIPLSCNLFPRLIAIFFSFLKVFPLAISLKKFSLQRQMFKLGPEQHRAQGLLWRLCTSERLWTIEGCLEEKAQEGWLQSIKPNALGVCVS